MGSSSDVKSASRVIQIIELLSHHHEGMTFTEIQKNLGIPKSSLSSLLVTIERDRWIEYTESTRRYRTGMRAWETSQRFVRSLEIAESAENHLIELRNMLKTTVHLAIRDGRDVLYISQMKASAQNFSPSYVGGRLPANATALGKSLLSGLSNAEITRLYDKVQMQQFTDFTITNLNTLINAVEFTRRNGFSEAHGDFNQDIFCVAAPIHDAFQRVVASISCTIPKNSLDGSGKIANSMRDLIAEQAQVITKEITHSAS